MTTPLIVISILVLPWLIARVMKWNADLGGLIGLSAAFAFFGVGHFVATEQMAEMLPPFVPQRTLLVYLTGVWEFALAAALWVKPLRKTAGWLCVATLIAFLPANIYAAWNGIGMGGHQWGPVYLLIRVPLQVFILFWAWRFGVRDAVESVQARADH